MPVQTVVEKVRNPLLKVEPIQWLIRDHIEAGTINVIFGPPGGGKSFIVTSMGCCISTNTAWYGYPVTQGSVLYIAGEGLQGILRRFAAWQETAQVDLDTAPLYRSTRAMPISDTESMEFIIKETEAVLDKGDEFPSVIIIDTLARNFGCGDENSARDMGNFINQLDEFFCKGFGSTVILVHHSGHATGRARGSSALGAAADAIFEVTKDKNTVSLINTKSKESEIAAPLNFVIRQVDLGEFAPSQETIDRAMALNRDVPESERVHSAVLDVSFDVMEILVGVDKEGFPVTTGDFVRSLDKRAWTNMDDFSERLSISKKVCSNGLRDCVRYNLFIRIERKRYELTRFAKFQLELEGAGIRAPE